MRGALKKENFQIFQHQFSFFRNWWPTVPCSNQLRNAELMVLVKYMSLLAGFVILGKNFVVLLVDVQGSSEFITGVRRIGVWFFHLGKLLNSICGRG
jgi:hypothetical protein